MQILAKWAGATALIGYLASSGMVSAADERRNGGDGVVCRTNDGAIVSAELLDFYESRKFRIPPVYAAFGGPELGVEAKLDIALTRLDRLSPKRSQSYRQGIASFFNSHVLIDSALADIPDSQHLGFPQGCKVEQVAVHIQDPEPDQAAFYVSESIWRAFDNDSRAGLILHEIIYLEAIAHGHLDSRATRRFTSYLASSHFESMSPSNFVDFLRQLNFKRTDIGGLEFEIRATDPTFYPSGALHKATLANVHVPIAVNQMILRFGSVAVWGADPESRQVEFFESGVLRFGCLSSSQTIYIGGRNLKFGTATLGLSHCATNEVYFYEDGKLEHGHLVTGTLMTIQGQDVEANEEYCVSFSRSGKLKSFGISAHRAYTLMTNAGRRDFRFERIFLNQNEMVTSWERLTFACQRD